MTAPWPATVAIGVLGLAIGSFLNVVIYRVPREESVSSPPSHCPNCERRLRPWHNVPVLSWLALRGRCAYCATPISIRYPLVEAGTAALFVAVTLRFGLTPALPAYLYLAAAGVALGMIDADLRLLPGRIVLPSYIVGALLLMPAGAVEGSWLPVLRGLCGMVLLSALFRALATRFPCELTVADARLAGLLGLFLGWASWSTLAVGVGAGLLIGALVTAAVTVVGSGRTATPALGPWMLATAALALFVAVPLGPWCDSLLAAA